MLHQNKELYHYLLQRVTKLTEEWYEGLDKSDSTGIYSSQDPEVIKKMKQQNLEFHEHFIKIFNMDLKDFTIQFDPWIHEIARDQQHLKTPLQYVIREFMRARYQYLDSIHEFAEKYPKQTVPGQMEEWNSMIVKFFDTLILKFTEETYKYSNYQLQAQQEMINELSSPVISLTKGTALLPLVGDIDTTRAKMIIDNALNQCSTRGVKHLCIDLSGVIMIDTMVAQQLFQLINALKLIGVKATLSGIRPEIASTAVKLGLSFDDVEVKSTLAQALSPKLSMI